MSNAKLKPSDLPDWPRLMRLPVAAAYCSVSQTHFLSNFTIAPLRIGGAVLWDRAELDIYISNLKEIDSGNPEDWLSKVA